MTVTASNDDGTPFDEHPVSGIEIIEIESDEELSDGTSVAFGALGAPVFLADHRALPRTGVEIDVTRYPYHSVGPLVAKLCVDAGTSLEHVFDRWARRCPDARRIYAYKDDTLRAVFHKPRAPRITAERFEVRKIRDDSTSVIAYRSAFQFTFADPELKRSRYVDAGVFFVAIIDLHLMYHSIDPDHPRRP